MTQTHVYIYVIDVASHASSGSGSEEEEEEEEEEAVQIVVVVLRRGRFGSAIGKDVCTRVFVSIASIFHFNNTILLHFVLLFVRVLARQQEEWNQALWAWFAASSATLGQRGP